MAETIFITGGSGFIGLAICRELLRQFPDVNLAVLTRSENAAQRVRATGARPVLGALDSLDGLTDELHKGQWVFHLGANAVFGNDGDYQAVNVRGTQNLVDALKSSPRLNRLIFTSTIGAIDRQPTDPCDAPLTVDSIPAPTSEYGRSKLEGERIVRESGLPFTIVRPSWVYGSGMRRGSHIAALLSAAVAGKPVAKFRFPGRVSVIHVSDLARPG